MAAIWGFGIGLNRRNTSKAARIAPFCQTTLDDGLMDSEMRILVSFPQCHISFEVSQRVFCFHFSLKSHEL